MLVTSPAHAIARCWSQRRPAMLSPRASWPRSSDSIYWARTIGPPAHSLSPSCLLTNYRWNERAAQRFLNISRGLQGIYSRRPRPDRLLQLRIGQQPLQGGLDFGFPSQTFVQLQAQPREVPMWCHYNETHVFQEVRVDDAMFNRTIAESLQHWPNIGADFPRILQLGSRLCATESFQRPDSAPDQLVDHAGDEAVWQVVNGLPEFNAHRSQQHGVCGHRCSGKSMRPRHRPRRRVKHIPQARRLALAAVVRDGRRDLTARSPLQHHHRQPGFLFEFGVGEMALVTEGRRIDLPEHAAACMLGELLEGFEPQRCDSSRHLSPGFVRYRSQQPRFSARPTGLASSRRDANSPADCSPGCNAPATPPG